MKQKNSKVKLKTKKAFQKRTKITGTGKVMHWHANTSHLAQTKSSKQKRHARKAAVMHKSDANRFKK